MGSICGGGNPVKKGRVVQVLIQYVNQCSQDPNEQTKSSENNQKTKTNYKNFIRSEPNELKNQMEEINTLKNQFKYALAKQKLIERIKALNENFVKLDILVNSQKELCVLYFELCNYSECKEQVSLALQMIQHFPSSLKEMGINIQIDLLLLKAKSLQEEGFYLESIATYKECIQQLQKIEGFDQMKRKYIEGHIGYLEWLRGNYNEGEKNLKNILDQLDENSGGIEVAQLISDYSKILTFNGKVSKAMKQIKKSLEIRQKVLDQEHPIIALTLNNLSLTLLSIGRLDEALKCCENSLIMVKQKFLGVDHGHYGLCLTNQALIRFRLGKITASKADIQKAEQIILTAAHFYYVKSQIFNSVEELTKSIKINQKILGGKCYEVGKCLAIQARIMKAIGQQDDALKLIDESQKIIQVNKYQNANLLNLKGIIYYQQGEFQEAKKYFFESLANLQQQLNEEELNSEMIKSNLNCCQVCKKLNLPNADKYQEEALRIKKKLDSEDLEEGLGMLAMLFFERFFR